MVLLAGSRLGIPLVGIPLGLLIPDGLSDIFLSSPNTY